MPWLMAITRHRIADRARRYARTSAHEIVVDDLDVTFAASETNAPEKDSGDRDALREAIRSLPPGQREAIELLKLKELSLKDAAAASGTTVGALKVATHRAMKGLREKLHAYDPARHR
jgi:RNA polymerase sigma-70 factor (ECF subfamily)